MRAAITASAPVAILDIAASLSVVFGNAADWSGCSIGSLSCVTDVVAIEKANRRVSELPYVQLGHRSDAGDLYLITSVGRHLQPAKFYGVGPSAGSAPLGGALLGRHVRLRGLLVLGAIVAWFVTAVPG
jgi:hypothetical protein